LAISASSFINGEKIYIDGRITATK